MSWNLCFDQFILEFLRNIHSFCTNIVAKFQWLIFVNNWQFGLLYTSLCFFSGGIGTYLGSPVNIVYYDLIINRYSFLDAYHISFISSFFFLLFVCGYCQGLDALGLATLDSINSITAARIPFGSSISVSMMTNEDVNNLRTLNRLILLLSGSQENLSNEVGPLLLLALLMKLRIYRPN